MGLSRCQQSLHPQARFYGVPRLLWRAQACVWLSPAVTSPGNTLLCLTPLLYYETNGARALILHRLAVRCMSIVSFVRRVYVPMQIAGNC
jgi:hypothetical protein